MASYCRFRAAASAAVMGLAGGIFIIGSAAGCSRTDDSGSNVAVDQPADGKSPAKLGSRAVDNVKLQTDADILNDEPSLKSNPKNKPTFSKYRDLTIQWDAASGTKDEEAYKTPRVRYRVKVMSDGSEIQDGPYQEWYRNGQVMQSGEYVDGVKQGQFKLFHENGKPTKTENYLNGKLEGAWKIYREDGTVEEQRSYKDNERDGRWIYYAADGKTPTRQEEYKAGSRAGTWIYYFPDGKPQVEEHFAGGKLEGTRTVWWDNGNVKSTEAFADGSPNGTAKAFSKDGKLQKQIEYKNGQEVTKAAAKVAGK